MRIPQRLLEALATVIKKAREPFALLLPLLWLPAAGTEIEFLDSPLSPSGLINASRSVPSTSTRASGVKPSGGSLERTPRLPSF
jgi:hypothetical protein